MSEFVTLKKESIPCKHYTEESQSHPYGMGSATETWWECAAIDEFPEDYDVDDLECSIKCPLYSPVEVKICPKHGEYFDYCGGCEYDQYVKEQKLADEYWASEGRR